MRNLALAPPLSWSERHVRYDAEGVGGDPDLACWNLIRSVFASELGRVLPATAAGGPWLKVPLEEATDFDLLVFGYGGMDTHLGLVVTDIASPSERWMLHLPEGGTSVVERYDLDPFKAVLKGVYRLGPADGWRLHLPSVAIDGDGRRLDGNLVVGRPFITPDEERQVFVEAGLTVDEILTRLYPAASTEQRKRMRTKVDGEILGHEASPEPGALVTVEQLPGAFGLRTVLQIAVTIAAITAATLIGGPWGSAASAAILIGGNLAINFFFPPVVGRSGGSNERSPTYSIQGWLNVSNPNGAIPALLGKHRVAPVKWAETFSRYVVSPIGLNFKGKWVTATGYSIDDSVNSAGVIYACISAHTSGASTRPGVGASWNVRWIIASYSADQWNYALLCGGYGPQSILEHLEDIKIGEHHLYKPEADWAVPGVPESNYGDDLEIDIREGYLADTNVALYTQQVFEETLGVELPNGRNEDTALKPTIRRTLADVQRAELDFYFPQGLVEIGGSAGNAGNHPKQVTVTVKYRAVGDTAWSAPVDLYWNLQRDEPFGHTEAITFPLRGPQYDISVERTATVIDDPDDNQDVNLDRVDWMSLKSFRPEYPVNFRHPLVLIAIKVKASHQLAGQLANLNYVGEHLIYDWDAGTGTWILRATSNPASIARWILQGAAKAEAEPNAAINLERFQEWHVKNATLGLQYNYVHDTFQDFKQALSIVAAAGHAIVWHDGAQWDVAIDEPQTIVCGHITPRNGADIKTSRVREKLPDAFVVPFRNRLDGYTEAERVVPFPGDVRYSTRAALFADLDWPAGAKGEVWGDPIPVLDGIYIKVGASGHGSWSVYSLDLIERWERPGLTHPSEVWRQARREQWSRKLRRRRLSASLDGFDATTIRPGNLVRIDRGRSELGNVSAVVKAVVESGVGTIVWTDEIIEQEPGGDYELRWRALPAAVDEAPDDPPALSIVRPVVTVAGRSRSVIIDTGGIVPSVGDLATFGPVGGTGIEAIVAGIDLGDRSRATVELYDHAPEITAMVAVDAAPVWTGRAGEIVV